MMSKEAMKLALEALENWLEFDPENFGEADKKAITALREALAEQPAQQEPVAWISKHGVVYPLDAKDEVHPINELQPLYTSPPAQRTWVGLTDEERKLVRNSVGYNQFVTAGEYAEHVQKATEFKLREKNT